MPGRTSQIPDLDKKRWWASHLDLPTVKAVLALARELTRRTSEGSSNYIGSSLRGHAGLTPIYFSWTDFAEPL
jgi:hypothetical protein